MNGKIFGAFRYSLILISKTFNFGFGLTKLDVYYFKILYPNMCSNDVPYFKCIIFSFRFQYLKNHFEMLTQILQKQTSKNQNSPTMLPIEIENG